MDKNASYIVCSLFLLNFCGFFPWFVGHLWVLWDSLDHCTFTAIITVFWQHLQQPAASAGRCHDNMMLGTAATKLYHTQLSASSSTIIVAFTCTSQKKHLLAMDNDYYILHASAVAATDCNLSPIYWLLDVISFCEASGYPSRCTASPLTGWY